MFLLKVATKHREQLFVDVSRFRMLIGGLAQQLKVTDVGKEHLIHRMAEGLDKMAEMLRENSRRRHHQTKELQTKHAPPSGDGITMPSASPTQSISAPNEQEPLDPSTFDFGDSALLGMPFFDFEGTTLDLGGSNYDFVT